MQIDLMLCDHAQVSGDKLFISGAGIDRMLVHAESQAPYVVSFAIGGIVTITPEEAASDHVITFQVLTADGRTPTLADADGNARTVAGELGLVAGDHAADKDQVIAFAFSFQGVPLFGLGHHDVIVHANGAEVRRIGFLVEAVR